MITTRSISPLAATAATTAGRTVTLPSPRSRSGSTGARAWLRLAMTAALVWGGAVGCGSSQADDDDTTPTPQMSQPDETQAAAAQTPSAENDQIEAQEGASAGDDQATAEHNVADGDHDPAAADGADESAPADDERFDQLVQESEEHMRAARYGQAHVKCSRALALKPSDEHAASLCAIAACSIDEPQLAKRYYQLINDTRALQVRQICLSRGVDLHE